MAAVYADGAVWLIEARAKYLEQVEESLGSEYARMEGLPLQPPRLGEFAEVSEESVRKLSALRALLASLEDFGMVEDIAWIDMSSAVDIEMSYLGRLTVSLALSAEIAGAAHGNEEDSRQIEAMATLVELLAETARGIIALRE